MRHSDVPMLAWMLGVGGLAMVVFGCAPDQVQGPDVFVQDSAGVRVVENRIEVSDLPVFAELGGLQVEVGVREGEPPYVLTQVLAVRTTSSGGMVIAESRSRELRYFDSSGRHILTVGGQGEGPGEFSSMSTFSGIAADTVWIWDSRNQRLTCFGPDGTLLDASVISPPTTYDRLSRVYRLSAESWVGVSPWRNRDRSRPESRPLQITRDSLVLSRIQPDGGGLDTIAVIPGSEGISRVDLRGTTIAQMRFWRPFGRGTYLAPGDRGLVIGQNERFEIRRLDSDGDLELVSRAPSLDLPVDPAEVEEIKEARLADMSDNPELRETVAATFTDFPLPVVRPAFSEIRVGKGGEVWLAEYEPDAESVSEWTVLDSDGRLLGRVEVPAGFKIHEIGEDYLLGVWYDEYEVPVVRRYSLVKTG